MRTKTLLLTAALAAAGIATSKAQTVYSVNSVGFVTITNNPGYNLICNPLNNATNTLGNLFRGSPENTKIFRYQAGVLNAFIYGLDDFNNLNFGPNEDDVLAPGEGVFIFNPTGTPFATTFVGDVLQGPQTNAIHSGFNLVGSKIPQAGQLDTALGYQPLVNDKVYRFVNGTYTGNISIYGLDDFNNLVWDLIPVIKVGEGFFISTSTQNNWGRVFSVNN